MQVINTENKLITTVFGFPLDSKAALCRGGGVDPWALEEKTKFCTSVEVGVFVYIFIQRAFTGSQCVMRFLVRKAWRTQLEGCICDRMHRDLLGLERSAGLLGCHRAIQVRPQSGPQPSHSMLPFSGTRVLSVMPPQTCRSEVPAAGTDCMHLAL